MKIIFINRFFFPDHSATSQMLSGIAFALARERDVSVITSRLRYDNPDALLPRRETIDGVDVVRVATSGFGRAWLLGRAFDYLTFYVSAAWSLMRYARRGDVVIVKTDPPMLSVVLWPVAALKGARLVNWLQDVFPEVATALGVGRGGVAGMSFAMLARLRNMSLRHAAVNVVLGDRMAELVAQLGVDATRIRIVTNWADGRLIKPVDRESNALRKAWGLEDDFVVGYSGNLGRAHDYETVLAAMLHIERLPAGQPVAGLIEAAGDTDVVDAPLQRISAGPRPIRWLFVGGGAQVEKLKQEALRRGLTSVMFKPYQPSEKLAESLSVPDVHLITLKPELEGLIVPSKLYGIAAAGRASIFIGDAEGEVAQVLRRSQSGSVVAEGDGEALAAKILDLAHNPERAAEQGARARALFDAEFDLTHVVQAWESVIEMAARG